MVFGPIGAALYFFVLTRRFRCAHPYFYEEFMTAKKTSPEGVSHDAATLGAGKTAKAAARKTTAAPETGAATTKTTASKAPASKTGTAKTPATKSPAKKSAAKSAPADNDAAATPKSGAAAKRTTPKKAAAGTVTAENAAQKAPAKKTAKSAPKAAGLSAGAAAPAPQAAPGKASKAASSPNADPAKSPANKTAAPKASAKKTAPTRTATAVPAANTAAADKQPAPRKRATPAPSSAAAKSATTATAESSAAAAPKTEAHAASRPAPKAAQKTAPKASSGKTGGAAKAKSAPTLPRSVAEADAMLAAQKAARGGARDSAPVTREAAEENVPSASRAAKASPDKAAPVDGAAAANDAENGAPDSPDGEQKRRRRSRRGGRRRNKRNGNNGSDAGGDQAAAPESSSDASPGAAADVSADTGEAVDHEEESGSATAKTAPKSSARQKGGSKSSGNKGAAKETKDAAEKGTSGTPAKDGKSQRLKMFISILSGEQVEVVLTAEGQVQEYYVEMMHQAKIKGNIYKGVVSNVDANLQAAFISYGGNKNGFLQIDEVHPEYYQVPHDGKGRKYPLMQKALKSGQEILVQVVKEPAGTKGAFLTSYLSLPGRFLVLTPGREQIGVSRKVDSEEERARLREMLNGLKPGPGLGVIVRTVSMGATKTSLQKDLQFLKRIWKEVRAKGTTMTSPCLIYEEMDLATRAIRDYLTDEVDEIWVDDEQMAATMQEMAEMLFPRKKNLVHVHKEAAQTLFERFSLQKQLDQIYSREVVLPSGGRLVFDHTEALTAIDINSSRSGGKSNFEDMAYRTNIEAARMIPLQLRLRDIGGQVVADFIEMRERDHWREVEKAVRSGMKGDRARYDVGKIGPFGMLEIVRQRLGSSAISVSTEPCPCCKGTGVRRNMEWQAMRALREIQKLMRQAVAQKQSAASFQTERELALHLLNTKRVALENLEKEFGVKLTVAIGV